MTRDEVTALARQVATEVLQNAGRAEMPAHNELGEPRRILFLCKGACPLPDSLAEGAQVFDLEDYEAARDITRYDEVVIGHLSTAQLSDLALARMSDSTTCAVLHALLSGIEVWLLDGALSFQKYQGKGSPALYQQLNDYVHRLQIYGIKLYIDRRVKRVEIQPAPGRDTEPVPVSYRAPRGDAIVQTGSARPNAASLITEADAVALIGALRPGEDRIQLDKGAILTPSARDVFLRSRIEVI